MKKTRSHGTIQNTESCLQSSNLKYANSLMMPVAAQKYEAHYLIVRPGTLHFTFVYFTIPTFTLMVSRRWRWEMEKQ
jgi:hypothetical protein